MWIPFFTRPSLLASQQVSRLIDEGAVVLCGPVVAELLQGLPLKQERELLLERLSPFPYVEVTRETWQKAGMLGCQLRERGLTVPLSDALVAALVQQYDLQLFTLDSHFDSIPRLARFKP